MNRPVSAPTSITWNTESFNGSEQYDAWVHALHRAYGAWEVPPHRESSYSANLRMTSFDDMDVAECVCDPCSGTRRASHIGRDDKELVVVQLTQSGRESIRFRDRHYRLGPGDILIWDSTRGMYFSVEERLDKISLILPLARLQQWMPRDWHSVPRKIPAASPDAILLTSYIRALTSRDLHDAAINGGHLSEAAIALLAGSVSKDPDERDNSLRSVQLDRVKATIDRNLGDPDLTLSDIADANDISLRYLHWLFRSTGETASRYIQGQRLARCRRDLENPLMRRRKIADIAHSWGFADPMHFSRMFKAMYGLRPSDVRKNT